MLQIWGGAVKPHDPPPLEYATVSDRKNVQIVDFKAGLSGSGLDLVCTLCESKVDISKIIEKKLKNSSDIGGRYVFKL